MLQQSVRICSLARSRMADVLFHHYVAQNDVQNTSKMIIEGANVDGKSKDGATALCFAAARDATEMLRLLLTNKADASLTSIGTTPLHLAAKHGHLAVRRDFHSVC